MKLEPSDVSHFFLNNDYLMIKIFTDSFTGNQLQNDCNVGRISEFHVSLCQQKGMRKNLWQIFWKFSVQWRADAAVEELTLWRND